MVGWRWAQEALQGLRLKEGAPDEPDIGDWDAICATPRIDDFFATLFKEVADFHPSKGCSGNVGLVVRAAIVSSFGRYFGQVAPFGWSSSSCAHSCLLSQFEQQR
jgi:hypothetical protein